LDSNIDVAAADKISGAARTEPDIVVSFAFPKNHAIRKPAYGTDPISILSGMLPSGPFAQTLGAGLGI
tara:strand:- start:77 stop:280 length:204 start_codon:yes stop_codon:yes gene_type:complete